MCYGISMLITGVVTAKPAEDENEDEGGGGGNQTKSSTDVCSEFYNSTLAAEKPLDNISHMKPGVHIALTAYTAALLVSLVGLRETKDWSPRGSRDSSSPIAAFKLLLKTKWLVLLTSVTLLMDFCQKGYLAVLFWFGAYNFGWEVSDFVVVIFLALVMAVLSNTVVLKLGLKYMGMWTLFYVGCATGIAQMMLTGLSASFGEGLIWIAMINTMFNVGKPILRGKITAEFRAEEQGKAISAIDVGSNFSGE